MCYIIIIITACNVVHDVLQYGIMVVVTKLGPSVALVMLSCLHVHVRVLEVVCC